MNKVVKCYEIASVILEEANKQFSPLWIINEGKRLEFQEFCDIVDILVKECDADSIEVEVDDVRKVTIIKLECVSLEVDKTSHAYYELAKRAASFGFSEEDGNTVIKFVFQNIWDKTIA